MADSLLRAVDRYAETHADENGIALTPVPGFLFIRVATPSKLVRDPTNPLVCLVLQGRKRVIVGAHGYTLAAGDSMLVASTAPTASRIIDASHAAPYLAVAFHINPSVVADLQATTSPARGRERVADADADLLDAILRLVQLLDRPQSLAVLQKQLVREIHHWLLLGKQGRAIHGLAIPSGRLQKIALALKVLRSEYSRPLRIERLAAVAHMGRSAFHKHFRAVTSLSPLQFQKQLRLMEARRLMLSKGITASRAAIQVGYASVSQFTREYGRMYGSPPRRNRAERFPSSAHATRRKVDRASLNTPQ